MNDRSGLLTLAAYITATMLIVLVAFLGIFRYGAMRRVSELEPIAAEPPTNLAVTGMRSVPDSSSSDDSGHNLLQQRVRLLETMLKEKSELLRRQAQQIGKQAADLTELRRSYENAMLAVESLQPEPANPLTDSPLGADGPDSESLTAVVSQADSTDELEAELMLARAVHDALVSDLDELQDELGKAYDQIDRMQMEADVASTNHLRDALVLEAASASIVLPLGRDAVPALTNALTHTSPVVRRWAATVLGGLGQEAGDATGALTEALSDSDPDVRRAAKAALDAIER